ncbi:MAG TPA: hypothetical protein VJ574_02295 [Candidatus Bathyarchaeia archaeon]|nr:hypothetical protein [Candidatus Bathyarchaeia archaeon]
MARERSEYIRTSTIIPFPPQTEGGEVTARHELRETRCHEALQESTRTFTLDMSDRLSLRLYSDTHPHNLEISPLHKGLSLMLGGRELIEEGTGFGVPVVKYDDRTYFSTSAQSFVGEVGNRLALIKIFSLDAISRKRLGNLSYINDDLYSLFHSIFENAYLGHKRLAPLFNAMMELRRALKVDTDFVKAKPRGNIKATYSCLRDAVEVALDFSELKTEGCQEILILNEQGSTFFTNYLDSSGLCLRRREIGAWERVRAVEASLSDAGGALCFTLKNLKDAALFRGWEGTRGRFSWAGFGYSLPPEVSTFSYSIKLRSLR